MIHYKDMTFCPFYNNCQNANSCHRHLTPQIQQLAIKAKLPISQFAKPPNCYKGTRWHEKTKTKL